ncbi:hypothetical protein QR685DRAFT_568666 [Neurospora intermedia]|uniref:Capsule polysaccharide biosynthesis protein n=1 Tax=Neurospora intermedia TaxID=5142 RepID=A0ABR3DVS1_NEUIN
MSPAIAKCASSAALFCFLRSSALWIVVVAVLVFGGLRRLFLVRPSSSSSSSSRRSGPPLAYRRRSPPPPTSASRAGPPSDSRVPCPTTTAAAPTNQSPLVGTLSLFYPVILPLSTAGLLYAVHRLMYVDWATWATDFFTGPGSVSRILLVVYMGLSWKNFPFMWHIRVFHAFILHLLRRPPTPLTSNSLFHPSITSSYTSPLETDYNLHKSNSTYFADLDVSRSHLVTHLLGPAMSVVGDNAKNKLVLDPQGNVVKGSFGIGLGAVFCSFRREIPPLKGYEMWSRILSWDRKWLYIVTHYVVKGKVWPTSWDGRKFGPTRPKLVRTEDGKEVEEKDFSKYVYATAISKYVFKLGRFTVHPSIVIEANGLLPERPGEGWRGGETGTGTPEDLGEINENSEWDWKRVEYERRKGMEYAQHFAALDGVNSLFDGGEDGAIGKFHLG